MNFKQKAFASKYEGVHRRDKIKRQKLSILIAAENAVVLLKFAVAAKLILQRSEAYRKQSSTSSSTTHL